MTNTPQLAKTIALGSVAALLLTAGVYAQNGQMNCTPGTPGKMQCGMGMSAAPPQPLERTTHTLKIAATLASSAKSGDNTLNIAVTNAAGKPVTAAKVTARVAMTSMDMGTAFPAVKETGKGHYTSTVSFSMAGPWRVTLKVAAPGQKPETKAFDFTAK